MERDPVPDLKEIRHGWLGPVPVGVDPDRFMEVLEKTLDEIYDEMTRKQTTAPEWNSLENQLFSIYWSAWGEYRSADTFARQVVRVGYEYPELKVMVARQTSDEMRHYLLYRDCALKMGGKEILHLPKPNYLRMFDLYDTISEDVVEAIFTDQFVSEKGAIPLFRAQVEHPGGHPEFHTTLEKILPDEYFHASIGRTAGKMLAKQGEEKQARMLDLASIMLEETFRTFQNAGAWRSLVME
jgi:hypothetical protein